MGKSILIYSDSVTIKSEYQNNSVWLENVSYDEILAEIPSDDIIDFVMENYHSDYMDAVGEANEE